MADFHNTHSAEATNVRGLRLRLEEEERMGARIKVIVENTPSGRRSIYRTVNSGGTFGASPLQQHIGLGKAARIVDVEIFWPVSNTRQHFANVAKNQVVEIRELTDRATPLVRKASPLGGRK